jgi:hypothetical protein
MHGVSESRRLPSRPAAFGRARNTAKRYVIRRGPSKRPKSSRRKLTIAPNVRRRPGDRAGRPPVAPAATLGFTGARRSIARASREDLQGGRAVDRLATAPRKSFASLPPRKLPLLGPPFAAARVQSVVSECRIRRRRAVRSRHKTAPGGRRSWPVPANAAAPGSRFERRCPSH